MRLFGIALPLIVAAFAAPFAMQLIPSEAMPQMVSGDDALSVAFGDAKSAISVAMVRKADSYFHGGIDMDCTLDDDDEHEHEHGQEAAKEESEHVHDGNCHHDHDGHAEEKDSSDPWLWINTRIRAPQIERHLEQNKIIETMPWFWVAVKADKHNIDAWTTGWYMAARQMKNEKLAEKMILEALEANPESIEVLVMCGRTYKLKSLEDKAKAHGFFVKARDMALKRCDGDVTKLCDDDFQWYKMAVNFLDHEK